MVSFSDPNMEVGLISFECNTVPNHRTKHHLRAIHEVKHYIFKLRNQGLFVDHIKEYLFVSCYLESNVSFYEENVTSHFWNNMVLVPHFSFRMDFEKQN